MSYGKYGYSDIYSARDRSSGSMLMSRRYNSTGGYNSRDILPNRYSGGYGERSSVSSRPTAESYPYKTPKYDSFNYSSSRTGRSETRSNEIIRPAMRSRKSSFSSTREPSRKSSFYRESSLPRNNRTNGAEYPELLNKSPARSSRLAEDLKFHTISSDYNKRKTLQRDASKSPKSYSITNGHKNGFTYNSEYSNGYPTKIEVERNIHRPSQQISVDKVETKSYSPNFAQNRTSNNNNKEYESVSGSSTRSSLNREREVTLLNREMVSSTSSGRDVGYNGISNRSSLTSTSSGRNVLTDANAGLVGLKNIGNTCFMNSILQCLSNTKPLRDYCLKKKYLNDIKSSSSAKEKLVEAFSDIIRQIWEPSPGGGPISTSAFKSKIQKFSNRFSGYEQQDSQEFLRFLIEGLHEDVNKVTKKHKDSIPNYDSLCDESKAKKTWEFYLSKDNSYIVDLFMGQLKSSLTCDECGHVSTTFDPFWDLSLPIPKGSSYSYSMDKIDLQQCLDNFTKEEILDRDERPTCDKCKARRRMTKKFTIYRFPKILVIHLKRFNEGTRYRQKLSNEVEFPNKLEISSPVSTSPASFNLYAVSNHSGSCYGGHYTAYCKHIDSGKWYSFNDSLVSSMSSSSVQSKEAYVLFYENSTSRSHL